VRIALEAHPNARVERVELIDTTLHAWVRARAVEGRANTAIEQAICDALGLRPRQVQLISGSKNRHKVIELDVADLDDLRGRLAQRRPP
jgi:uncharacterized protein